VGLDAGCFRFGRRGGWSGRGGEGSATAGPERGGRAAVQRKGRCGGWSWKGRARRLAVGGAAAPARPAMGGAGSLARLRRSKCTASNGTVGACDWAGEGRAHRLGGQPGEGQTRRSARGEARTATCHGVAQAGKGGGATPVGNRSGGQRPASSSM
jgi:hypothetical protein